MLLPRRASCFALLLFVAGNAHAQGEIARWSIPTTFSNAVGQAQSGRVIATENNANRAILYSPNGVWNADMYLGTIPNSNFEAVETTDGLFVAIQLGGGKVTQRAVPGGAVLHEYSYPVCGGFPWSTEDLIPMDNGQVLVAVNCASGNREFDLFDRNLNIVGSYPGRSGAFVRGLTRRPDGSFVACTASPLPTRLTAYAAGGSVLWDVPVVGAGGSVGSDAGGNLYVCHGDVVIRTIDVFNAHGALDHSWTGPPLTPFYSIRDIASSLDGNVLYVLDDYNGARSFGGLPTATKPMSWGSLKQHYR